MGLYNPLKRKVVGSHDNIYIYYIHIHRLFKQTFEKKSIPYPSFDQEIEETRNLALGHKAGNAWLRLMFVDGQ